MTLRKKSARLAPYHFTGEKKKRKKEKENTSGQVFFPNTSTTITKTNKKKPNLMDLPDADDSRLRKTRSICSIEMRKKKKEEEEKRKRQC